MDNKELVADIQEKPAVVVKTPIVQPIYAFSLTESAWRSRQIDLFECTAEPEFDLERLSTMPVGVPLLRLLASKYCRITDPETQMKFLARVCCSWLRGVTVDSYPDNVLEIHSFCTALNDYKVFCKHDH